MAMHPRCPICSALFIRFTYDRHIHAEYGFCAQCQQWFPTVSGDPQGIENEFEIQFQQLHQWYAHR
jgi:hypothetical protein